MVYAGTAKSSDCTLILTEGPPLSLPQHAANPHLSIFTYTLLTPPVPVSQKSSYPID